jgi:hypothetical protein
LPDLYCVPPDQVWRVWSHVRHWIAKAIERGGDDDYRQHERDTLEGLNQLWIVADQGKLIAAAITKLVREGGKSVCIIVACGGEGWKRFGHLIGRLESFAKDEGCEAVRVVGRKGWQRLLPDYEVKHVRWEKRIA